MRSPRHRTASCSNAIVRPAPGYCIGHTSVVQTTQSQRRRHAIQCPCPLWLLGGVRGMLHPKPANPGRSSAHESPTCGLSPCSLSHTESGRRCHLSRALPSPLISPRPLSTTPSLQIPIRLCLARSVDLVPSLVLPPRRATPSKLPTHIPERRLLVGIAARSPFAPRPGLR